MSSAPDLAVQIGPLRFPNPIMVASGTFGYGIEFADLIDVSRLGAIVTKSCTLAPRAGHEPPRVVETPAGLLNAIGLQNDGIEMFIQEKLPKVATLGAPVIVSIAGDTVGDFVEIARRLAGRNGFVALELNVSCPNQERGGIEFGVDPESLAQVVGAVRSETDLPLIVKLSPNVTDIVPLAETALRSGAQILSLINTVRGIAINPLTGRFRLANRTGGLSGPAIKPIALYHVWRAATELKAPIIGIGGAITWQDALEFIYAGASAVQIGSGSYVQPTAAIEALDGLSAHLSERKIKTITELIGQTQPA